MNKIKIYVANILLVLCLMGRGSFAKDVKIVATVNGTPITSYELNQRMLLAQKLLGLSGIRMSEDKVRDNVLSEMIDDKLKIAEAKKYSITVSKDEMNDAKKRMEGFLGLENGEYDELSKELGIEESIVHTKVMADVIWMKFMFTVLRSYINITDSEVNLFIDNIKNESHFVYGLIPLMLADGVKYDELKNAINEISDCEEFKKFAMQNGLDGSGDLITIRDEQMEKSMARVVAKTSVGKSVNVKKMDGEGVNVFFVCEKNLYKQEVTDEKKEELKSSIFRSKLEAFANKYFDKMKKTAVIDIKKD